MSLTTNEGCPIRWCSPFTYQPTAIKSFSSSFFAISPIFEKSHQLLQSRSMDCGADCPEVQLLAGGPTEDFTREGDHLHRLTTLNSLPRGCCVISSAIGSSREDIMTDTNKRLAIVTDARGIGVM